MVVWIFICIFAIIFRAALPLMCKIIIVDYEKNRFVFNAAATLFDAG